MDFFPQSDQYVAPLDSTFGFPLDCLKVYWDLRFNGVEISMLLDHYDWMVVSVALQGLFGIVFIPFLCFYS